MTLSLTALRSRLEAFDDEIKEFESDLRKEVADWKAGIERQRKDFAALMEEQERVFFAQLDGRIEHWRRNQKSILLLLDAEVAQATADTAPAQASTAKK